MQVTYTTAESWLGRPLASAPSIDEVVLRYLAAFGPATVADIASWSRLTGMRAVVDRLGDRVRVFGDQHGRELYDLPAAPRPDPDAPAPVRFLPEYDNALLSHAARERFSLPEHRGPLASAARRGRGTLLVDGTVRGTWRIERANGRATLFVDHAARLGRSDAADVEVEGRAMLAFLAPERAAGAAEVRLARLDA
jgi:hypothetical protein